MVGDGFYRENVDKDMEPQCQILSLTISISENFRLKIKEYMVILAKKFKNSTLHSTYGKNKRKVNIIL